MTGTSHGAGLNLQDTNQQDQLSLHVHAIPHNGWYQSNQTSSVSRTALYCSASAPINSDASRLYQPSMPSCSISFATSSISSGVRGCNSLVSLCTKNGIGTPQVRRREIHQSGRPSIIAWIRFLPQSGTKLISFSIAFSAF